MLKQLHLQHNEFQKVYFVSDYHYNHQKDFIWRKRGFSSPEEHNRFLIEKTNEIVRPNDILFCLGDYSLNCSEEQFENFLSQLNCQKIYTIWGNHNSPLYKIYNREVELSYGKDKEVYPIYYKQLIFLGNYVEVIVNGQFICLSHYPISVFNHGGKGSWMLCGHSHGSFKESLPEFKESKRLDVGWDVFKKPLSFDEIKSIMETKQTAKLDHHG